MQRAGQRVRERARGARGDSGAAVVELAFIGPVLLLLIFSSIQLGLWWYGRTVAIQAAREGVSSLRLAPDQASYNQISGQVTTQTEAFAAAVGREALLSPVATPGYDDRAGRVSMRVTGRVITLWPGPALTVTQQAFGEVERFRGDLGP
jgi:Flp pilus assembly protein TadG